MNRLVNFFVTIGISVFISVSVGTAVIDAVDQKLQPLIEALGGGGQLPAQSPEPLRQSKPAPEDYI